MEEIPLNGSDDNELNSLESSELLLSNEDTDVEAAEPPKPGMMDLVKGAPLDLWIIIIVVFMESFAYFSVSMIFMMTLEEEYGMNDVESSSVYAMFGVGVSIHSILFGWVVDKLFIRKSMLVHVGMLAVSKILLGLFPSRVMLWIMILGPLSFGLSIGATAVMVAIRRYTAVESRSVGFSLKYISMNIGAFVASPVADIVRTKFVPIMEKMDIDGFSLFIAITGVIHIIDFFLIYYWVRDVYVPEGMPCIGTVVVNNGAFAGSIEVRSLRWPLRYIDTETKERTRFRWNGCREVLRNCRTKLALMWNGIRSKFNRSLIGLATLTFGVLGAKSVFRFLDSLYPLYMERAPFPVEDPTAIPYLSFLTIDPLLVMLLTAPVANFFAKKRFHPYWVILFGISISALAPFFMVIVQYWAVIAFIVTMSLAEIIWSPMLATYACWFAPQGEEGVYLALSALPVFAAKGGAGWLSGTILNNYCPSNGTFCHSVIWVFVGLLALSSPVIVAIAYKLVKIENPAINIKTGEDIGLDLEEDFEMM